MNDNEKDKVTKKDEKIAKNNFFKKIWYSITKIEKYPEMSAEGFKSTMKYFAGIVAILVIVICIGVMYQTNIMIEKTVEYAEANLPDFSYKDGKISVDESVLQPIKIEEENLGLGKIIIDTTTADDEIINSYKQEINNAEGKGIIILQDKIISQNSFQSTGTVEYKYDEVFNQMGLTEFTKKDAIEYAQGNQKYSLYLSLFLTLFISYFIWYAISTLWVAAILAIFGFLIAMIMKMKMRYVAIFNMAIYSLTLSTILQMIYIIVNAVTDFTIAYFQVMYISVAFIYLVAAIFILRAEFLKQQGELTKIAKIQEKVNKENEEEEEKEKEKQDKEKQERKRKDKQEEKKKGKENGKDHEEPEGSEV